VSFDRFWEVLKQRRGKQDGTRAMVDLLLVEREQGYDALRQAIEKTLEIGCSDVSAVLLLLNASKVQRRGSIEQVEIGNLSRRRITRLDSYVAAVTHRSCATPLRFERRHSWEWASAPRNRAVQAQAALASELIRQALFSEGPFGVSSDTPRGMPELIRLRVEAVCKARPRPQAAGRAYKCGWPLVYRDSRYDRKATRRR
jgi:hypothetical protein